MKNFSKQILRITVAVSAVVACASTLWAANPLVFPGSESAQVAVLITDVSSHKVIDSHDEFIALVPASTAKCITSATALRAMGADSVPFVTEAAMFGHVDADGCLHGLLRVEASADPTLGSCHFSDGSLVSGIVSALKDRGITSIDGKLEVQSPSGYYGVGLSWEVEDIGEDYGAGLYGFNWRDNIFSFAPHDGLCETMQGDVYCHIVPDASSNCVVRGVDSPTVTVYRKQGSKIPSRITTTMWNPAECFISELADSLSAAGIELRYAESSEYGDRSVLVRHVSPSCAEILRSLMRRSDNLFAEGMLRATLPVGCSLDSALSVQKRIWMRDAGFGKYSALYDGSGLSRKNRITPRDMTNILSAMLRYPEANDYVGLFPVCGKEGTVARLLRGTRLQGKVRLKSGSMGGVLCYAGYVLDKGGRQPKYTISIMVNGFTCPVSDVRKSIERYLLKIIPAV